jgi:hypothetical protein
MAKKKAKPRTVSITFEDADQPKFLSVDDVTVESVPVERVEGTFRVWEGEDIGPGGKPVGPGRPVRMTFPRFRRK